MIRYVLTGENKNLHKKYLIVFIFIGLIVAVLDRLTPLGFAEWVLYLILVTIYRYISESRYIAILAIIYSVMIIVGFFLSPPGDSYIYALFNRSTAIIALAVITYLSVKERAVKKGNAEILERISDSFIALDNFGNIIYCNKRAMELSGKEELIGKNIWDELPALKENIFYQKITEALKKQVPMEFKMQGTVMPFIYYVSAYPSSKGISIFTKNVTELDKAENELKKALKEKDLLLREIHHRVKNNFQLISSLLGLSSHTIIDKHVLATVSVLQQRIRTLATIHEKLYLSENIESIDLQSLISDLVKSFGTIERNGDSVKTEICSEDIRVNIHSAIPLGSIVTELYTNSIKHAFGNTKDGLIKIHVKRINQKSPELELVYFDNGKGLPENFNINNCESLGFTIITSFVEQLNGHMSINNNHGAEFRFLFRV